jgi:RHS repeat-associated protein
MALASPVWAVSISITSPANSIVAGPATITLTAAATPGAGRRILRVDFFKGTTRVGSRSGTPYSVALGNIPFGTYVFTALAIDSGGSVAISDPVVVRVDSPPAVSLTAPVSDSSFAPGANITLTASASDSDEIVKKVEFFAGDTLIGTRVLAPYQITWSGVAPGRYSLTARATDLAGLSTASAPVMIAVGSAPTVTIVAPTPGAVVKGATITVTVLAADSDGAVAKVEFFDGGGLVGTATTSSGNSTYSTTLNNLALGSHILTARATDDQGFSTSSIAVQVTVTSAVAQIYYIHTDHLNTPRLVANQQATSVWKWDQQEPFGSTPPNDNVSELGAFDFPVRFPGQYADRDTSLAFNFFRDYDSTVGRYIESDPVGLRGGINTYAYVGANPISRIDPTGQLGVSVGVSVNAFVTTLGINGGTSIVAGEAAGTPNICIQNIVCFRVGLGLLFNVATQVGISTGPLCSGTTKADGVFAAGVFGPVIGGIGGVRRGDSGGVSVSSGGIGIGAGFGGAAGVEGCQVVMTCFNDPPCCKNGSCSNGPCK